MQTVIAMIVLAVAGMLVGAGVFQAGKRAGADEERKRCAQRHDKDGWEERYGRGDTK